MKTFLLRLEKHLFTLGNQNGENCETEKNDTESPKIGVLRKLKVRKHPQGIEQRRGGLHKAIKYRTSLDYENDNFLTITFAIPDLHLTV
jgi:hypothetical protein